MARSVGTADAGPATARQASAGSAAKALAADPVSRVVFLTLTTLITLAYTLVLPFAFTQRLSIANWHFLTTRLLLFAVALGVGMALVLTVQIYAMRRAVAARRLAGGGALGGLALIVSILPTFLCCTPVIPTLLATIGVSATSIYGTTGTLQRFFSAHQIAFFTAGLALLALTAWWSLRRVARASCLDDAGCATDSPPPSEGHLT